MVHKPLCEVMKGQPFCMVPLGADAPALAAVREGRLQPRDLALLLVLIHNIEPLTGRCWLTTTELAAQLGHNQLRGVNQSIRRLRNEGLIARGTDRHADRHSGRVRFWCVDPYTVACTGGAHRRAMQVAQFEAALQ